MLHVHLVVKWNMLQGACYWEHSATNSVLQSQCYKLSATNSVLQTQCYKLRTIELPEKVIEL